MPEDRWYILPVLDIEGRVTSFFCARESGRPDAYAAYREASHLLGEPPDPQLQTLA